MIPPSLEGARIIFARSQISTSAAGSRDECSDVRVIKRTNERTSEVVWRAHYVFRHRKPEVIVRGEMGASGIDSAQNGVAMSQGLNRELTTPTP